MIEAGIALRLLADPTVSSLIADRLYDLIWPDNPTFPLLTSQLISTVTQSVFSGPLSMATVRMQYDAWGKSYSDAKAAAAAITACLEGFQGTLPDGTAVDNITLDSSFDLYDSPSLSYRVSSDFLVSYYRS